MRNLPQDSGEYFSALRNLHTLTLYNISIEHLHEEGFRNCFSAFRETLTSLSLETFAMSFGAFVALIDYFPNIAALQLRSFEMERDKGPIPSLSRPLRGQIHVLDVQADWLGFFDRFAKLDLEYEQLVISSSFLAIEAEFMEKALQISPSTVKSLRLTSDLQRE